MSQEKFQQAINLFKAGNKKQAGDLLLEVVNANPRNAEAWFGLALCTDDMKKKKYFLEKVIELNPQHSKASQLLEKFETAKPVESSNKVRNQSFPIANAITSILIGVLVLCVAWLFYKVNILEKSLLQTQNDLAATQTELNNTQLELSNTRSALASTIDTLAYVQAIAENANRFAHSHNNFSDSRLKVNISPIKDPLQGLLSLNGVTFYWNTADYPELELNSDPQIGFIAQELEQVYPELVHTDENGFKTVDYVKLIPVLTEAIKQQQLMIIDLQKEITKLRKTTK